MRQMERTMPLDPQSPHVINIGKLVEEHENKIRNTLNDIYFGKSRDIVNGLRYYFESLTVFFILINIFSFLCFLLEFSNCKP